METKYGVNISKLNELKKFQLDKLRKISMNIIGDIRAIIGEDTVPNHKKNLTGRLSIGNDKLLIEMTNGKTVHINFCEIIAYSIVENTMKIQVKPDDIFERCAVEFHSRQQADKAIKLLPIIERPNYVDHENNVSSDSEFNDSGTGKTEAIINSFDSDNPSEHDL